MGLINCEQPVMWLGTMYDTTIVTVTIMVKSLESRDSLRLC
jgi:hypothetical protein